MKKFTTLLVLISFAVLGYSQEIKPVAAGEEVVMVKDTSILSLKNTYLAGKNKVFLLLDNGEFRIFDEKTKKIFTATNLNNDIKETEYIHLLLDDKEIKIKGN